MAKKKTKKHLLIIRVGMDKACSRATALRLVKEELKGQNFYPSQWEDTHPGEFWIRAVRSTGAGR